MVVLLAAALCGAAPPAQASDLLTAYRQAATSSPELAGARALLQAAKEARPLARAGLLPQLRAAAGISRNQAEITGFGPTEVDEPFTADRFSVTLTQPLYNAPAYVALDAAKARVRAAAASLDGTQKQLAMAVSRAYFAVLRAAAERRVARGQRTLLQQILDQAETALRVGSGDIVAVQEARARRDAAATAEIRAGNALRIARRDLERLTHAPVGRLRDLGPLPIRGPQPARVVAWIRVALKNRPLLARARQLLQISRRQIDMERRARWPRLDLQAAYQKSKGDFLPSIHREEALIGVNLSLPLFQGGAISARTRQAQAQAAASREQLAALTDQVRLEVENAFLSLQNSVAEVKAADQALASATTSLAATRQGYRVGSRSIIDLLTVVQDHADAQRSDILARYDHVLARLRLKRAAGTLTVQTLQAVNALLTGRERGGIDKGTSP